MQTTKARETNKRTAFGPMSVLVFALLAGLAGACALGLAWAPTAVVIDTVKKLGVLPKAVEYLSTALPALAQRLMWVGVLLTAGAVGLFRSRRLLGQVFGAAGMDLRVSSAAVFAQARKAWLSENRTYLTAVLLITVCGAAVRLTFLFQPMRCDESTTYCLFASQPLYIGLTYYPIPNNHILHTLLVHFTAQLGHGQPWAIRLPALFAGILLIPACYFFNRMFYGYHPALYATALVAASSTMIDYSTNARGYTLLCLFTLVMLASLQFLIERDNLFMWLVFVLSAAAGCYTVPVMLLPIAAGVIWYLGAVSGRAKLSGIRYRQLVAALLAAGALVALLYLPVVIASGLSPWEPNESTTPHMWAAFRAQLADRIPAAWAAWHTDLPPGASWFFLAGIVAAILMQKRARLPETYLIPACFLVCILALATRHVPYARDWLFLLPLYLGAAMAGWAYLLLRILPKLQALPSIWSAAGAVALCLILSATVTRSQSARSYTETGVFPEGHALASFLHARLEPGDAWFAAWPVRSVTDYYLKLQSQEISLPIAESGKPRHRYILVYPYYEEMLDAQLKEAGVNRASGQVVWQQGQAILRELSDQ
jgi:hypothetical protein